MVMRDVASKTSFQMQVVLFMTVNDFSAPGSYLVGVVKDIWHVHHVKMQHLRNE